MSKITTHILDTALGKPASDVAVKLSQQRNQDWIFLAKQHTNKDGRISQWCESELLLTAGIYRLRFETKLHFDRQKVNSFYPFVDVIFQIQANQPHYHIPLLISPFGYSTYRGS